MRRTLPLLVTILIAFTSCVEEINTNSRELIYEELLNVKEQIENRLEDAVVGTTDGTYPAASFIDLEKTLVEVKKGISMANAGVFILQFEIDNYVVLAKQAMKLFDDSIIKVVLPGTPAEIFVNGAGSRGHIDFGTSPDYSTSNMTIETWLKYPEGYIETGFGSLISTFISPLPYKGWTLHFWGVSNSMLRFSVGTDHSNVDLTLPTVYTSAPSTYDKWFHLVAVLNGDTDKMEIYIDGEIKATLDMAENMVLPSTADECRMWAFKEPKDNSRCVSGSMKKFRLWSVAKTASEVKSLMTTDVVGTEANLTCAWDFTVKPEDDGVMIDKTGRHTAKLVGVYKWISLEQ